MLTTSIRLRLVLAWLLCLQGGLVTGAEEIPTDPESIGGKWYVKRGDKPVYYYRDADRFVDLFSYHAKDSNKDGIDNVRISHDSQFVIIDSQGYPNHPTAKFPNSGNPNTIRVQDFHFRLPLEPKLAGKITRVPMGPIGMALNGVVFFNPFEAGGMNAVAGYSEVWLDSCCGHPQQHGVYHYHKYPSCVKSPFPDDSKQHSPIIGFAWDGFPIYGPYEEAGVKAKDLKGAAALDVCNGHHDKVRGYHYHVTPGRFPYVIGGYAGVVEPSNSHELRRGGEGAIQDNSSGDSRLDKVIASVKPVTAGCGKKQTVQIQLVPANARFGGLPMGKPDWVQFGPYEAIRVERTGNVVTVDLQIPEDAAVGVSLDCHIEFENTGRGGTLVFKRNDAFRIVE
jgi:hypothetical protein